MNRHSVQRQRIGPAVRRMRRARGLTLDELAEVAAVSPSHLSRLERSQTLPSFPVLAKIADALGVDVNEFVRLEQDVARLDEELADYAQLFALDAEARRELLDMSIEARREFVTRMDQLATLTPTSVDVQDQAVRALESSRDDAPFSSASTLIERSGLDAVSLSRLHMIVDLLHGRRSMVIAGPSLLPISPGHDAVEAYRWAFPNFPIDPSVATWWRGTETATTRTNEDECPTRALITAGALSSPIGPMMARSMLDLMGQSKSAEVAVTDRSLGSVSLLTVSGGYALLEQLSPRRKSTDPMHVAIWLTGDGRVGLCDKLVDRIWDSLTSDERSPATARGRLLDAARPG